MEASIIDKRYSDNVDSRRGVDRSDQRFGDRSAAKQRGTINHAILWFVMDAWTRNIIDVGWWSLRSGLICFAMYFCVYCILSKFSLFWGFWYGESLDGGDYSACQPFHLQTISILNIIVPHRKEMMKQNVSWKHELQRKREREEMDIRV